ncbi:hypothetical protein SAMN05443287_103627 [Micromonospora phaseoli]|uniref:DUF8175 domain-containing protein n=1 Tax=Micromonospora phaseoli TaxID=1144548 RepID=A0A1H6XN90_9ACTN|nr:hypothetical protein [Micromonospora phaseoli]PZW02251.1 hypothetical protein CLV64_102625 [Micromonospora phaseoli]GIJ75746.1 hypothetical protein Xph01_01780 [Micromonospora phaseoli]SEJ28237.1 hypothetical protein SAMN05443287_103627 [Micromonospora phaseoli]
MRLRFATDDEVDEERPFWQHRRWQLSAAFLALALCTGTVAALGGGRDAPGAAAAAGPVIGPLDPDGSRPQGCRTDDSGQRLPSEAPRDVTWRPLNGAETPLSASAGPLKTTGPLLWCFAHTPMGAVMAAHTISRQMSGPDWRTVSDQQLVPGLGRDYFDAMRASMPETGPVQTANALAGFLVLKYSPKTATVRVLVRQAGVVYVSLDYIVDWNGVDWQLRPLNSGGLYSRVNPVVSLVGFVLWNEV